MLERSAHSDGDRRSDVDGRTILAAGLNLGVVVLILVAVWLLVSCVILDRQIKKLRIKNDMSQKLHETWWDGYEAGCRKERERDTGTDADPGHLASSERKDEGGLGV